MHFIKEMNVIGVTDKRISTNARTEEVKKKKNIFRSKCISLRPPGGAGAKRTVGAICLT